MRTNLLFRSCCALMSASATLLLGGCGLAGNSSSTAAGPASGGALTFRGTVFGGQQPVAGSVIQMYAVGTTGYGSASTSVLNNGVTVTSASDGSGSFTLTGKYTCSAEQRVYLTASGGDAGGGPNNALAMMAALGRCGDLTSSTFININEVTTVASVWALAPFMSGPANVGAPASNVAGLNNAFADVNTLASIRRGVAGGDSLPAGTTIPAAAINTLADILASCVNSNGSGSSACAALLAASTVSGVAPTDTLAAALNIAQHPASNVTALYGLLTANPPFQPTLPEKPGDFTLSATFSNANLSAPSAVAMDAAGDAWIADAGANKLVELAHSGAPLLAVSGLSAPSSVAIDQSGNAWVASSATPSLTKVTSAGSVAGTFTGGGLNAPRSVSIDGQGYVWVANAGNNSVSEFNPAGVAVSGASGFAAPSQPLGVALNPR